MKQRPRSETGVTRSYRVLVVDDDPLVVAGTAEMLEDLGYEAIEASSGAGALDRLQKDPEIDVVVTDYAMPGMNGAELAARIHSVWPDMPIAIISGYAAVLGVGADLPRLNKPYRRGDLAALIDSLTAR